MSSQFYGYEMFNLNHNWNFHAFQRQCVVKITENYCHNIMQMQLAAIEVTSNAR